MAEKKARRKWWYLLPLLLVPAIVLMVLQKHRIQVSGVSWTENGEICEVSFDAQNSTDEEVAAGMMIVASTYLPYVKGRGGVKAVGEKTLSADFAPGEKRHFVEQITIPKSVNICKVEVFPDK